MGLKHVGKVKNTGRRCIIVFRELYDKTGHVIDDKNCLVVETDALPDAEHQDIMRILESNSAQATGDLYNVLARERMSNGYNALSWLDKSARLRKYETTNVLVTPDASTSIPLNQLNTIVRMQKSGASQEQIANAMRNDTDKAPRVSQTATDAVTAPLAQDTTADVQEVVADATSAGADGVLDDAALARSYVSQARMFEAQAADLRQKAINLDATLAPKKARSPKVTPNKAKA